MVINPAMSLNPETRNLIGGRLVGASNGATFENINPATEEVIGVCADGTEEDMLAAIAAARRAFDETRWSTDHAFRKKCLNQLAEGLAAAKDELRDIVVAEAGSPMVLATIRSWARRRLDFFGAKRRAWSVPLRPGTSRSISTCASSGRRSPLATRWC
jgi:acyl-CoA reductase-like NAD-dependent aldehyde dehydrogenase